MAYNTAGMTTSEKLKSKVPGTDEYAATHGFDKNHAKAQELKAHLPGTQEHRAQQAGLAGTGAGYANTGGMAAGHHTGHHTTGAAGTGMTTAEKVKAAIPGTVENREKKLMQGDTHYSDTGLRDQGYPMGATTTSASAHGTSKPMATKLKEMVPGTQENKMHKIEKEMHGTY